MSFERTAALAAGLLVAAGIGGGLFITGSPQHARTEALDVRRSEDLSLIAEAIERRLPTPHGSLPPTLPPGIFTRRSDGSDATRDPLTGVPYRYHRTGPRSYQLCATFAFESTGSQAYWIGPHPAGRACYAFILGEWGDERVATPGH
jgi:hypothetical protein